MLNFKCNLFSVVLVLVMFMVVMYVQVDVVLVLGLQFSDSVQNIDQLVMQGQDGKKIDIKCGVIKLQVVEVSGFVSSLENFIVVKCNVDLIVEVVLVEQIGKLLGVFIVDMLGCLFGLVVQEVSGCLQVLIIYGLGLDFFIVLVNGGQQVLIFNNCDVQFDQYFLSWFNIVVVYFSLQVNLIGQGLVGMVDMQIICLLEKDKVEVVVNVCYIWNDQLQLFKGLGVSDKGYNFNGVWVNQFVDYMVGVIFGVDFEKNFVQIQYQVFWGYLIDNVVVNGNVVVGGVKNYGIFDMMKCNGLFVMVQWQLNEYYIGMIDMMYINFKEVQQVKGMELLFVWGLVILQFGYIISNGLIISGIYIMFLLVICNDYNSISVCVYNFNWDNKFYINEDWFVDLVGNYLCVMCNDINLESYLGLGFNKSGVIDIIGFVECNDGLLYVILLLDYINGVVLIDLQGWGGGNDLVQVGFINVLYIVDYLVNFKLSVQCDFVSGLFFSLEVGVVYSMCNKIYYIDQIFLILGGGIISGGNVVILVLYSGIDCSLLVWMGISQQFCYDLLVEISNGILVGVLIFGFLFNILLDWKVCEKVLMLYFQFNFDMNLGNMVILCGNFGMQMQYMLQCGVGECVVLGSVIIGNVILLILVEGSISYNKYLLSVNLIFGFSSNDDVCVSVVCILVCVCMDQMNFGFMVYVDISYLFFIDLNQVYFKVDGGNVKLKLIMVDNYNVSYEYYFLGDLFGFVCNLFDNKNLDLCCIGGGGYFLVLGYFIVLYDYINLNVVFLYDFSLFLLFGLILVQEVQLGMMMGIIFGFINDGCGYVKGVQVILNLLGGLIILVLNGFGVIFIGNCIKSLFVYGGNLDLIMVLGLFKWVVNGMVYYQYVGFEVCISDNYCFSFLGEVLGISVLCILQMVSGGSIYDVQVSYIFDYGLLDGLMVIVQGLNLLNKIFIMFQNNDLCQVFIWECYGCCYEVGVFYKFQ